MKLQERLVARVRKEFPDLKFNRVKLVTKGWDHDVIVLDNKLIFRFPKEKLEKKSFVREVNFLREFSKISNLPVPNYIYLARDMSFGGYEMIKGKELTPAKYAKLSTKQKRKIIKDLAKFVSILHTIPIKEVSRFGFKRAESWQQSIKEKEKWYKDEFLKKVAPKLTKEENDFINKHYKSQAKIKPALGHFDLSHDHIIMKPDGTISGIIDFGDMTIGDPAHEFNGFFDFDEKLPQQIYKLYTGPKDKNLLARGYEHYIHRWIYLLYDGLVRRNMPGLWKEAREKIASFL